MHKNRLFSLKNRVIIFCILLVGIGFFVINAKTSWDQYSNSRYHFSIAYPSDWKLQDTPTNNDGGEFVSPDRSISCRAYGFQNALVGTNKNNQTLTEFINWLSDAPDTTVISVSDRELGGILGQHLVTRHKDYIRSGTYSLGPEIGYAFVCFYQSIDDYQKHTSDFEQMAASFTLEIDNQDYRGNAKVSCKNYINGVVAPLQDRQTFTDKTYTEVTMISKENWDRSRLPTKVADLESLDYTCYSMPSEFKEADQTASIDIQPEVTLVEWTCELEYTDYQYISSSDNNQRQNLESKGYYCEKEACFLEDNRDSYVWMCAKIKQ
jgi:hypothetical protein